MICLLEQKVKRYPEFPLKVNLKKAFLLPFVLLSSTEWIK